MGKRTDSIFKVVLFFAVFSLMIPGYAIPSAIADPPICTPSTTTLCLIIEETSNDESTDDAEEKKSSGKMDLDSGDIDLSDKDIVGLRFNNILIPQGTVIQSAHIEFTSEDKDKGDNANARIQAEATDNASTFTNSKFDISSRTLTAASVDWTNIPDWSDNEVGPDTQTPDIASIVQEVIDRPGWSSGNSIAFVFNELLPLDTDRDAYSFEHNKNNDHDKQARLHIECAADCTTPPDKSNNAFEQTAESDIRNLGNYVILGIEKVDIGKSTIINNGNVGVQDIGSKIKIEKSATFVDSNSAVVGDKIKIDKKAIVQDVYYNKLKNKGTILGSQNTPLELPVVESLPDFPTFTPGNTKIKVPKNSVATLEPGDYGKIIVKKSGTLNFIGGTYNIKSIQAGKGAQLLFDSSSEIRVEKKINLAKGVTLGPSQSSSIDASDIVFFVGENDSNKKNRIVFGKNSVIDVNIFAPNGKIVMKKGTDATGSFIAKTIKVEKNSVVTLDSAFDKAPVLLSKYASLISELGQISDITNESISADFLIFAINELKTDTNDLVIDITAKQNLLSILDDSLQHLSSASQNISEFNEDLASTNIALSIISLDSFIIQIGLLDEGDISSTNAALLISNTNDIITNSQKVGIQSVDIIVGTPLILTSDMISLAKSDIDEMRSIVNQLRELGFSFIIDAEKNSPTVPSIIIQDDFTLEQSKFVILENTYSMFLSFAFVEEAEHVGIIIDNEEVAAMMSTSPLIVGGVINSDNILESVSLTIVTVCMGLDEIFGCEESITNPIIAPIFSVGTNAAPIIGPITNLGGTLAFHCANNFDRCQFLFNQLIQTLTGFGLGELDKTKPTLIVINNVNNDEGGILESSDFTITVNIGREPFLVEFPGQTAPGTTIRLLVDNFDVTTEQDGYTTTFEGCDGVLEIGDIQTCIITNNDDPSACSTTPPNLLGWWPGDGNTSDLSGNDKTGTLNNGATFAAGKVDQAFSLNGISDDVSVGSLGIDNVNDAFSIVAWVNPDAATTSSNISQINSIVTNGVDNSNFGNVRFFVLLHTSGILDAGSIELKIGGTGSSFMSESTVPVLTAGQWTFVVATYDGSATTNGIKIYIDGIEQSTTSGGANNLGNKLPRDIWTIGGNGNIPRNFGGLIDEVQIFDRVLTPQEIQEEFSADSAGKCKTPGILKVIKEVNNDEGGPFESSDFVIQVSGNNPNPASFAGATEVAGGVDVALDPGAYSVTEDPVLGYVSSFSASCEGIISAGATKTCTITNNDSFIELLDASDSFGHSIANMGDLNGDGTIDLAVSAVSDNDGGQNRGAVWILFLNVDGTIKSFQKISDTEGGFAGTIGDGDLFGRALANIGDVDGDGVNDLAVGVRSDDGQTDSGATFILFLRSDGTVKSFQKISNTEGDFTEQINTNDSFGFSLAGSGDLNADSVPDLVIGANGDSDGNSRAGAIYTLFLENDGTTIATTGIPGVKKISSTEGNFGGSVGADDRFGWSVENIGDLNGDGVPDLAVGAIGDDDGGSGQGAIYILLMNGGDPLSPGGVGLAGTVQDTQKISDIEGDFAGELSNGNLFGHSIALIRNFDGNSVKIAVGAVGDFDGGFAGAVWILSLGSDGKVDAFQKLSATEGNFVGNFANNAQFGFSVEGIGDFDGDGTMDLAVGAPGAVIATGSGAVWILLLNPDGTVKSEQSIPVFP